MKRRRASTAKLLRPWGGPLNLPKAEAEAKAVKRRDLSKIPNNGQSAFRCLCWHEGSKTAYLGLYP